jgi:hypothetical protein
MVHERSDESIYTNEMCFKAPWKFPYNRTVTDLDLFLSSLSCGFHRQNVTTVLFMTWKTKLGWMWEWSRVYKRKSKTVQTRWRQLLTQWSNRGGILLLRRIFTNGSGMKPQQSSERVNDPHYVMLCVWTLKNWPRVSIFKVPIEARCLLYVPPTNVQSYAVCLRRGTQ